MIGQVFGALEVIADAPRYANPRGKKERQWACRCICGAEKVVRQADLKSGNTSSCGCLRGSPTHRQHGTATYQIWGSMLSRCRNPNDAKFADYGERGITVCDRWLRFENFLADMGERPSPSHSIEREDNSGRYEPRNCRWATRKEQQRNTRRNHLIPFKGRMVCLAEAAELTGLKENCILKRLQRGWSVERALGLAP